MKKLNILMLEDNLYDAELIIEELRHFLKNGFNHKRVETREDLLHEIYAFKPDIILSDFRLPQYNGLKALEDVLATRLDIPFIIVTGSLSEETAADTIKAGAWDYVVKERLFRLESAVSNAIQLSEEKSVQEANKVKLQTLSKAVEDAPVSIAITKKDGEFEYVNPKFESLTGYSSREVIGKTPSILKSGEHNDAFYKDLWETILKGKEWQGTFKNKKKDGSFYWGSASISSIKDDKGNILSFLGIEADITKEKQSSDALQESEQRYQLLSNATFEAIFILEKGVCVNQNKSAEKIFGYSIDEVIGKPLEDLVEESSAQLVKMNTISGYEKPYEAIGKRKDGSNLPIEIQSKLLLVKGRNMRMAAVRDITLRKVAQTALIESEKKYRELIENQGEGILITNMEEQISFANNAAEIIFGVAKDRLTGMSLKDFTNEEGFEKIKQESQKRKKGSKSTFELIINPSGKSPKQLLVTATPRLNESGEVIGSFGIFRDITERHQMLLELREAKIRAEESDRLKTVFLQNMSHEVRTPMNGIIGFAEMINDPEIPVNKKAHYANIIINNSKQLLSIIQDIITISSIETRQEKISSEAVNINDLFFELQAVFAPRAKEKNITFKSNKTLTDEQVNIITDRTKCKQILENLISNAIKFTHDGSIEYGYTLENDYLEFYVRDTGIGIKKEWHSNIFNRFWQVEQGTTRKYGGNGLGLSIAKGYVELLGGKIWLESSPEKGSTFYFNLPYNRQESKTNTGTSTNLNQRPDWNDQVFLIAEDEYINYLFLEELLVNTGARVFHARNGKEAIKLLNEYTIDLILMDLKMPEMDGYEATREIRKTHPELPVIAQTAYINTEDRNKALAAGCNDFIEKPIMKQDIFNKISQQLNKGKKD